MVQETVCHRYVREDMARGRDTWEVHSGHGQSELGHVGGGREERGGTRCSDPEGQRYKKGQVAKMSGLYRKETLGKGTPALGWRVQRKELGVPASLCSR